ncbi:hypothetical protein DK926_18785 [Rhodococcus sp. Eu-32]|uniref:hypothetical protein n=1 Tax=Rhodococcus sp. Eu-32 TaxID=1017319 RepID=UPI000DF3BD50|nr:hypothetical protein [Rhodococcus sp. Eu-32]RRQ26294.1 hypothetical protein DK926_18785 [Rhodococcus sp. Eu-32]
MAREFGKLWFVMFQDDDFCAQPLLDKMVYVALLGLPSVNYAGLTPLSMKRLKKACAPATELEIKAALVRLERKRYVFTDSESEEQLIRTFIRNDEVWKQPNMMISALRSAGLVESRKLASVLSEELDRVDMPTSAKPLQQKKLDDAHSFAESRLNSLVKGVGKDFPEPFAEDFPKGLPEVFARPGEMEVFPEVLAKDLPEDTVVVAVAVESSSLEKRSFKEGAYVNPEGCLREASRQEIPPSKFCEKHPAGTTDPCRPCGAARAAHAEFMADKLRTTQLAQSRETRERMELRLIAIAECDLCDESGYVGMTPCDHNPHQAETNRAGIERARAALAKASGE